MSNLLCKHKVDRWIELIVRNLIPGKFDFRWMLMDWSCTSIILENYWVSLSLIGGKKTWVYNEFLRDFWYCNDLENLKKKKRESILQVMLHYGW